MPCSNFKNRFHAAVLAGLLKTPRRTLSRWRAHAARAGLGICLMVEMTGGGCDGPDC